MNQKIIFNWNVSLVFVGKYENSQCSRYWRLAKRLNCQQLWTFDEKVSPNIIAITLRDNSVRVHQAEKERNVCLAEYIAI